MGFQCVTPPARGPAAPTQATPLSSPPAPGAPRPGWGGRKQFPEASTQISCTRLDRAGRAACQILVYESFLALVLHLIFKYLGQLMQATTMQTPHDKEGSPWSVSLPPVPRARRPGAILACTNPCSPASCERVSRIAALNRVCRELRGATGVYMGKLST